VAALANQYRKRCPISTSENIQEAPYKTPAYKPKWQKHFDQLQLELNSACDIMLRYRALGQQINRRQFTEDRITPRIEAMTSNLPVELTDSLAALSAQISASTAPSETIIFDEECPF
jgi:hypothetical protein